MLNLKGKTILITGGTGSFGNTLLDYLRDSKAHFVIYSRDESKQHDMYVSRHADISYIIGDVRDKPKLIYSLRNVDYVFHAAALKHVPTGENFPEEVVSTNILGTKNVIEAAEYCSVKRVVVLSTDKAVYPISAYGMSKALAEKVILAYKGNTENVCLRYGNVLGSRGSVIPLFLNLINQSKPLTVTNLSMTRFLLTPNEAVKLALKCLYEGGNGDLFVMKPPACSILNLVRALELHYQRKLPMDIIGIRPGEKMHETLLTGEEVYRSVVQQEGGITYSRLTALDRYYGDFHLPGPSKVYIEPEPFTSANTEQYGPSQVLAKIEEAELL